MIESTLLALALPVAGLVYLAGLVHGALAGSGVRRRFRPMAISSNEEIARRQMEGGG